MGGVPTACVVNLAIRPGLRPRFFDRLYAGLGGAAEAAGVDLVGGNVTAGNALAITIALIGETGRSVMRRDTARPGDGIFVTGTVGDAAIGWRILAGKMRAGGAPRKFLVDRFLRPTARLAAGQRLAKMRRTPAAIDLSDGLLQDLGHILERSGVGAELDASTIPRSQAYRAVMGDDLELALSGGEDYELLFCLPARVSAATLTRRLGLPVTRIGKIVRGHATTLIDANSSPISVPSHVRGWDQLRPHKS